MTGDTESEEAEPESVASFAQLFRFATWLDLLILVVGILGALTVGVMQPLSVIYFGEVVDEAGLSDPSMDTFERLTIITIIQGGASFLGAWLAYSGCKVSGLRQGARWRRNYLEALVRQDIAWYDTNNPSELATLVASTTHDLEDGISGKLANGCRFLAQGVSGIVIAFYFAWDMALVLLGLAPIVMFGGWYMSYATVTSTKEIEACYGKAGGISIESISEVRTVTSLSLQNSFAERYSENLNTAKEAGVRRALRVGFANGLLFASGNYMAAIGFIYGAIKIAGQLDDTERVVTINNQTYTANCMDANAVNAGLINACDNTGGDILIAIFALQIGCQGFGLVEPMITALAKSRRAAARILDLVDRKPPIDVLADEGKELPEVRGEIVLKDVHFTYPARPEHPVCRGYNLTVGAGQTVALVGASGSGKSTVVQLVERFYDPDSGSVTLDGVDLRELNLKWLRRQIGLVGQEPVLFSGTIAGNIGMGAEGATQDDIQRAAKMANAYDFILSFPDGFDTDVGEKGGQLSGGQKQRIAIARAMVKDPKVLLLDEATSALDTESERIVQAALDRLLESQQRTTIVIAHRLSTIRNVDKIAVVHEGRVVEEGTYDELMGFTAAGNFRHLNSLQGGSSGGFLDTVLKGLDPFGCTSRILNPPTPALLYGDKERPAMTPAIMLPDPPAITILPGAGRCCVEDPSYALPLEGVAVPLKTQESQEEQEKEEDVGPDPTKRVWGLHDSEDKPYFALGCLGALLVGGTNPAVGVIFVLNMNAFYQSNSDTMKNDAYMASAAMIGLATGQIAGNTLADWGFGVPGEKLTMKLRQMFYTAIMRQEVGWHDMPDNASGALCSSLATEVSAIQALSGQNLGKIVLSICAISMALGLSFGFGAWQITLVAVATIPVMVSGMIIEVALMSGDTEGGFADERAGRIVGEVVTSIRTVASFTLESYFIESFRTSSKQFLRKAELSQALMGGLQGYSQGALFLAFALLYWYGGVLVTDGETDMEGMFIPILAIFMIAAALGQAENSGHDVGLGTAAARRVFAVVDREPCPDSTSSEGLELENVCGKIVLKDVHFTYPARPEHPVCRGYNLTVGAGQTVALVGASGSGKSTVVQLVERFYDPDSGSVTLDGVDLRELNLKWLRRQIGLVGQEPVLFSGTIAGNIGMGTEGATQDDIQRAARMANAYDFILSFPDGFDTDVGEKGGQLSGGQKQRIAIARAMVKDPKVLLLDEATSALDTESERIVQAALDRLLESQQRTTIVIAHRLSTIRNVDKIAVVHEGRVVEEGTYDQLMNLGSTGKFYSLAAGQSSA